MNMFKKTLITLTSLLIFNINSYALDLATYGIENDLIAGSDYYYTNGFFYRFHDKSSNDSWVFGPVSFSKESINSVEFVQQIYTPFSTRLLERPISDHPYVGKIFMKLISNNQGEYVSSKIELSLGILGPNSGSKFVQNFFHQLLPASKVIGWNSQVKNDYLINYNHNYAISLISTNMFTLHFLNDYKMGTNYTGITAGIAMTLSNKSKIFHDYYRQKHIELGEFLFRVSTQRDYMIYDSALMGGIENEQENALSYYQLEKLVEHSIAEVQYTWTRLTLKIKHHILGKKIITGKKHEYTGIDFIYRY
jgi:hypothetical protein